MRKYWVLPLLLAAALRFYGLDWGLRHPPEHDEDLFVVAVAQMLEAGDLDPRYYEYPGVPFYLLLGWLSVFDAPPFGPSAYLAARVLIAAAGVLTVWLTALLGTRVSGPFGGLVAALFVAISPVDVHTAHMFRPDVLLQVGVLLALLAFRRVGPRLRDDALAGAALGLCFATKFTGLFLLPSYLYVRASSDGPRWRGLALAGVVSASVFFLMTPYAWQDPGSFFGGVTTQVTHHYPQAEATEAEALLPTLGFYLLRGLWGLGALGAVAALLGLRDWRAARSDLIPLLLHAATTLAVMSTAEVRFQRHLVPVLPGLAILVGRTLARVDGRSRALAGLATLLVVALPLTRSVAYVSEVARPSTRDRALDWLESRPAATRVATSLPLGRGQGRFELVPAGEDPASARLLALELDLLLTGPNAPALLRGGLDVVASFERTGPANGEPLTVYAAASSQRRRYVPIIVSAQQLRASDAPDALALLFDGNPDTFWHAASDPARDAFVQVDFPEPVRLGRIVLELGTRPRYFRPELRVDIRTREGWRRASAVNARPTSAEQLGDAFSQVLLRPADEILAVRIVHRGARGWGAAELRLDAVEQRHSEEQRRMASDEEP